MMDSPTAVLGTRRSEFEVYLHCMPFRPVVSAQNRRNSETTDIQHLTIRRYLPSVDPESGLRYKVAAETTLWQPPKIRDGLNCDV